MNDLSHHLNDPSAPELPLSEYAALEMACEEEIVERILRGEWDLFWDDDDYRDDMKPILWDLFKARHATDADTACGEAELSLRKMAKDYAYHYVLSADAQDLAINLGVE